MHAPLPSSWRGSAEISPNPPNAIFLNFLPGAGSFIRIVEQCRARRCNANRAIDFRVRGVCAVPFSSAAVRSALRPGRSSSSPQGSGKRAAAERKRISDCFDAARRTQGEPGHDARSRSGLGWKKWRFRRGKFAVFPCPSERNSTPLKAVRISRRYERRKNLESAGGSRDRASEDGRGAKSRSGMDRHVPSG